MHNPTVPLSSVNAVAVLYGGWSHESNLTAHVQVIDALEQLNITPIPISVNDPEFLSKLTRRDFQVAFITNQGAYGEDGKLQGLLDILDIKYVGSGVCASAMGMNKLASKLAFLGMGLTVADYCFISATDEINGADIIDKLGLPLVVKPVMAGSSYGLHWVQDPERLPQIIRQVQAEFGDVLVEEYIDSGDAYEYAAGILEDGSTVISLPVCRMELDSPICDLEAKHGDVICKKEYPDSIDPTLDAEIRRLAREIHIVFGCSGLSRTDFQVDRQGNVYVLEVNTLPGLLPTSAYPKGCQAIGISYPQMIFMLLQSALVRKPVEISKICV